MPKWSQYILNLGTAGPATLQGIKNLGFALTSEIPGLVAKYVRVDAAQAFTSGEQLQGRDNIGLGTIATQDADAVAITGGSIEGIDPMAVADGGTGADNAPDARTNLGLGNVDNTSDADKPISDDTQAALDGKLNLNGGNYAGDAVEQAAFRADIGADILGGFRNLLINPLGTINQRVYTSGAATSGANQYTLDRWRVVTSGQNLAWTESEGVRTMTAPAGGVEQVVDGRSILTGDHVLSWTGTATATVNGTARTVGEVFTLTGGSNATVRFSNGTFSLPQLERASSATAFAARSRQEELAECEWFYRKSYDLAVAPGSSNDAGLRVALSNNAGTFAASVEFSPRMRGVPTVTLYAPGGGASALSTGAAIGESGFQATQAGGVTDSSTRFHFVAIAEI